MGEQNEIFLKAYLLQQMHNKEPIQPFGLIKSLDFGPGYKTPKWLSGYSKLLKNRNYIALKDIIPKAPISYKADIGINRKKYSVKYSGAAKAAIVNHTSRKGFKRVIEEIGAKIEPLDKMINEYWEKRESGIISEDIKNSDPNSPFKDMREYFEPILKYFLFEGSGNKVSDFKSDFILEFSDPLNPQTYSIHSPHDVISTIWDNLVFSLRSKKGMPTNYDPSLHSELEPWVRYMPDKPDPKGALHIRI